MSSSQRRRLLARAREERLEEEARTWRERACRLRRQYDDLLEARELAREWVASKGGKGKGNKGKGKGFGRSNEGWRPRSRDVHTPGCALPCRRVDGMTTSGDWPCQHLSFVGLSHPALRHFGTQTPSLAIAIVCGRSDPTFRPFGTQTQSLAIASIVCEGAVGGQARRAPLGIGSGQVSANRQRQVWMGKALPGYQAYTFLVPSRHREVGNECHPVTPPPFPQLPRAGPGADPWRSGERLCTAGTIWL